MCFQARVFLVSVALGAISVQAETVQEIADRIVFARGGRAILSSVQSERLSGQIVAGDDPGSFVMDVKRPNMIRLEVNVGDNYSVRAYDGKTGWKISSRTQKTPERMAEAETKELIGKTDIDGPFVDFKANGTQIEILDKEMLGSSLVWKLKVTLKDGAVSYYYVESTGYFVLMREQLIGKDGQQHMVRQFYQNFQRVQNMPFPFLVIAEDGVSDEPARLKFEKVEINVPEEVNRFTLTSVSTK